MYHDHKNLPLIREKVAAIKSALFSNAGCGQLKYNTCIISALNVDEQGCIWFLINRNGWRGFNDDLQFPASLSFHRKGITQSLSISGKAEILSDNNIIRHTLTAMEEDLQQNIPELLLVKLSIGNAVFFDWTRQEKRLSWLDRIYNYFKMLPHFNSDESFAYKAV